VIKVYEKEKVCWWMDESTMHCWLHANKTWSGKDDPVTLPMQATRGESKTIIAAIGGDPFTVLF
jgi:hypothetical protein